MGVKKSYFIVVPCLLSLWAFSAQGTHSIQGWGRVKMQGAIIDTACAIAIDSREQTIGMGSVPLADIIRDGQGRSKHFSIKLENCIIDRPEKEDWKQFQVTFDGDAQGQLFEVQGDVSGVSLKITDAAGNIAKPGVPLPMDNIIPGSMTLNYSMTLMANSHALKTGDYFSFVRFKLDYF